MVMFFLLCGKYSVNNVMTNVQIIVLTKHLSDNKNINLVVVSNDKGTVTL